MASVWKCDGDKFWRARYRLPNGKYTNRSTKETNRVKAQRQADKLEEQAKLIGQGQANEKRLLKAVVAMAENSGLGEIKILSIRETLTLYLKEVSDTKPSAVTLNKYTSTIDKFINFLGESKANQSINTLSKDDVKNWRAELTKTGIGGTTVDQSTDLIKRALDYAVREGKAIDNVAKGISPIGEGAETKERFSEQEIKDLYEKADEEWKGMILVGLWYGMRINDAANLKWENIKIQEGLDQNGLLTYVPSKTRKKKKNPVELGMPESVFRYMLDLQRRTKNPTGYIFPSLGGKKTGSGGGLSNSFNRLMKKAGIVVPEGEKKTGKGRRFKRKGFHSLRHTMISRMTEAGIPHELGMAISVHSNRQVHERYVQFTREIRNSVFKRMPDFLSAANAEIEYYI
jgi:integrase